MSNYLLQLMLPQISNQPRPAILNPINKPELANIGGLVSQVINVLLILSAFLMLGWMSWGVFQYIFAGGNKEQLAKARQRLIYAVVGFLMVVIAFSVSRYVQDFFPTTGISEVKEVSKPGGGGQPGAAQPQPGGQQPGAPQQPLTRQQIITQATDVCQKARAGGIDISQGPCLSEQLAPDWVLDIAHQPRLPIDDLPQNQCQSYRNGTARNFVELDTNCRVINISP